MRRGRAAAGARVGDGTLGRATAPASNGALAGRSAASAVLPLAPAPAFAFAAALPVDAFADVVAASRLAAGGRSFVIALMRAHLD